MNCQCIKIIPLGLVVETPCLSAPQLAGMSIPFLSFISTFPKATALVAMSSTKLFNYIIFYLFKIKSRKFLNI